MDGSEIRAMIFGHEEEASSEVADVVDDSVAAEEAPAAEE
jgi:hypothetical protein